MVDRNLNKIKAQIENKQMEHLFIVDAFYRAITSLTIQGELNREETLDYFEERLLLQIEILKMTNKIITTLIILYMMDLYPEEKYESIKRAFALDLVDKEMTVLKEVDDILNLIKTHYLENKLRYEKPLIIKILLKN